MVCVIKPMWWGTALHMVRDSRGSRFENHRLSIVMLRITVLKNYIETTVEINKVKTKIHMVKGQITEHPRFLLRKVWIGFCINLFPFRIKAFAT